MSRPGPSIHTRSRARDSCHQDWAPIYQFVSCDDYASDDALARELGAMGLL